MKDEEIMADIFLLHAMKYKNLNNKVYLINYVLSTSLLAMLI